MDTASECSSISMNHEEAINDFKNPNYEESQKIRDKYCEVSEKLRLMSVENGDGGCSLDELTKEIASINQIVYQERKKNAVTPASEGNLDARILKEISRLAKANIEKTQTSLLTFKPAEYAKLVEKFFCNGQPLSQIFEGDDFTTLNKIAKAMSCLYRSTYGLEPLYGALEWEPPARPAREAQRRRDDLKNCVKKIVREVQSSATGEENQTVEVKRILRVLSRRVAENKGQPINFLQFVIDPTCFSTTVQNIFHTSFLITDRMAKFSFDKYKVPYISPELEGKGSIHPETNHQSVVEMSLELWENAIKILEIDEAMIPNVSRSNKRPSQSSQF
ncbi:UNVERIFIED_CONTAM: hypothetical protein RMT77_016966 [Armadillidium vulgare]